MRGITLGVWLCVVAGFSGAIAAQDSTGAVRRETQSSSPPATPGNPLLFLIRDPVVQSDLALTPQQKRDVRELTDRLDIPLWGIRDLGPEQGEAKLKELIAQADSGLATILKDSQRQRLDQIVLRSQGTAVFFRPDVAERLRLLSEQQRRIQRILEGGSPNGEISASKQNSKEKPSKTAKATASETKRSKESEAKAVAAVLTDTQTRMLSALLGKPFTLPQGYKIAIKAPELATADAWINSEPLSLEKLRGQVIVLNFWTYG
jgi:hypothetical protein